MGPQRSVDTAGLHAPAETVDKADAIGRADADASDPEAVAAERGPAENDHGEGDDRSREAGADKR